MDKNTVAERIRALVISGANRPEAARLRDVFDEVEIALKAKVPQTEVLAELHKLGFTMKIGSFKSALQRIRKERKNANAEVQKIVKTTPSQAAAQSLNGGEVGKLETIKPANVVEKTETKVTQNPEVKLNADLSLSDDAYESFKKKD